MVMKIKLCREEKVEEGVLTREKRDRENSMRHRIVLSFLASSSLECTSGCTMFYCGNVQTDEESCGVKF